jgi:hypothetical protein
MFRYGGPIKEGVMSGIREPKKTGGSMGNLVGSPAYPKTDGREHHFAVSGTIAGLVGLNALRHGAMRYGARYLPRIWQGAKRIFGKTTPGGVQTFSGPQRTWNIGKGFGKSTPGYTKDIGTATFKPNWLGRDPLVQSLGWAGKTLTSGPAKSIAGKVLQFGASPTTLIGGLWYANGKWFNKDGSPANEKSIAKAKASTGGPPGGGDPGMQGTGEWFAAQAEKEALAKKQKEWNNRIKKYRDIMDIKGMNKEAAYKSLVDASKLIQESGDFKGDIRSGKLINQVIQAASKQFDKPKKTSDAINTLILQNELKKDLSAETDALDKEYKRGRIAVDKKTLNPSFSDMKVAARKNMDGQSAWDAAAASTSNNFRGNIIPNSEWVKIKKDIKETSGEVDDITIIANWTTETIKDKNVPDGDYTVGDALVTIQNNQVTNVNR